VSEPTRVYIAAPWKHKRQAKKVANQVAERGYEVTSSWIDLPDDGSTYEKDPAYMASEAERDLLDLTESHIMLYLNLDKSEGKATELGWALRGGMPVYVIGGKQGNVFLHLPEIIHIDNLGEFFDKC
jgi:hypothetical protein